MEKKSIISIEFVKNNFNRLMTNGKIICTLDKKQAQRSPEHFQNPCQDFQRYLQNSCKYFHWYSQSSCLDFQSSLKQC